MTPPFLREIAASGALAQLDIADCSPDALAVAVSGGVDSVVLLHALVALGARPTVVSIDHGLRPESADEVRFVGQIASDLGLPFVAGQVVVSSLGSRAAAAREARYRFFEALPQPTIALGHHRDDQAETTLDHLARGSGARGLAAMQLRRGRYVRPLISQSRAEILAYAQQNGLRWVEDPSNSAGTRGALRSEVLPVLERLRPGASAAIARSARLLAEDDALLERLTTPLFQDDTLNFDRWLEAPVPLRRRALLRLARQAGAPEVGSVHIDAALGLAASGAVQTLPLGWSFVVDPGALRCLPPKPSARMVRVDTWGLWRIEASEALQVRPVHLGETLSGKPVREGLRALGLPPSLRAYHPVFERGSQRFIPGLGGVGGEPRAGVAVLCLRQGAQAPGGGPFRFEL